MVDSIRLAERYANWNSGLGYDIERGEHNFNTLSELMLEKGDASANISGRQEFLENYINRFV